MSEPTATNPQTGEKLVFRGGQWQPLTAAPSAPAMPQRVYGAPKQLDQPTAIELERLDLARAAGDRADRAEARAVQTQAMGTESERTAGFLAGRVKDAILRLSKVAKADPAAQRPTLGVEAARGVFGDTAANYLTDPERQQIRAAQIDIIDAALTLGTGAAYTREQLEGYRESYFPKLGDDPATVASKREALRSILVNAQTKAGRAAPDIEAALAALDSLGDEDEGISGRINMAEGDEDGLVGSVSYEGPNPANNGGSGLELLGRGLAEGTGDLIEGAASLPGLLINPVGQALYDVAGYDARYDLGDILRGSLGLPESAPGLSRTMRQGAAAALTGGGAARAAGTLFNSGVTGNVLSTIGRTPIRDAAAGAGAAGGGEIGQEVGGIPGQAAGMVAGGLAGYTGAGGVNALAGTIGRGGGGGAPNALARAAERQRVDLLPADAGGPVARAVTTGTKASPLSVAPVVKAAQGQQQQFGAAVTRATGGEAVDAQAAGESIRRGAQAFTKQTAERGARLYDKAAQLARNVKSVRPVKTLAAIDAALARAKENPAGEALVKQLTAFRSKIEAGVTIQGLRDARTSLSEGVYDGKLRGGSEQRVWKEVLGNVAQDIDEGLRSVGQDTAADMFRSADEFWARRVEHIDTVLQPIIGKDGMKGGEQVLQAVESMARGGQGGNARLSRLLANMPDAEARQVRATIVDRLGKANPGAQDAEGATFSASTFLTNWNKMTPQAKASLFGDGNLRADLNDLAKLAEGMKASQAMANFSNTGVAIGANAGLGTLAFTANPLATILAGGAQYLTGKLMASPGFARLLARTAKMPTEAANRTLREQLGVIAGRDSLVATDARGLQQFLADAVSRSPQRAAAEDEGNRR